MTLSTHPLTGAFNMAASEEPSAPARARSEEQERWRAPAGELAGLCVRDLQCQAGRFSARLTAEPRSG